MNQPPQDFTLFVASTPLTVFDATPRPSTPHGTLVFLPESDRVEAAMFRPPGLRDRLRHRYWCHEIDTAWRAGHLSLRLPAAEEAFFFRATVSFTWVVEDPVICAQAGIEDARAPLWQFLDRVLRRVSRNFPIEKCAAAEDEMNRRLRAEADDLPFGLRIAAPSVDLFLDERAAAHLGSRVETQRAHELAADEHNLAKLRRGHEAELAVLRGRLSKAESDHELELKRQRLDFYRTSVSGGRDAYLILQLIEHPEDIKAVVQMLDATEDQRFQRVRRALDDLMNRQYLNTADMDTYRERVLDELRSSFGPVTVEKAHVEADVTRVTTG